MAKVHAMTWPEFWALVSTLPNQVQVDIARQLALASLLARLPPRGLVEVLGDAPPEVLRPAWPMLGLQTKLKLLKHWGVDVRKVKITDPRQLATLPAFIQERS